MDSKSDDELLAYRRRGDNARPASVKNVAVRGGLYGLGELGDANENMYQGVEAEWPKLRRDLIEQGDLQGDQRRLFALFAALQLMRTEKHAERLSITSNVAATTAERPVPRGAVRDYLRDLDGGAEPDESEVEAAWSYVCGELAMFGMSTGAVAHSVAVDVAVTQIAPRLETMNCRVPQIPRAGADEQRFPGSFVAPAHPRPAARGISIETADEVRFPRSPSTLLVMSRAPRSGSTPQRSTRKARAINTEIARRCHQFIFGTRQSRLAIHELALRTRRLDSDSEW